MDEFRVHKYVAYVPVSCCLMTDSSGIDYCDHPPIVYPRAPWYVRAGWLVRRVVSRTRYRIGVWVAGVELLDGDDS